MVLQDVAPGTHLLLIRHGETEWNREGRVQGQLDVGLSPRGLEQARRLAAWLADEPIAAVYSSDLQRARVTAQLLAQGQLPVATEPRVREARFGVFEGLTGPEIQAAHPEAYHAWRNDAVRHRPPGGETLEEMRERCMAALQEHLPRHPGQTVAIVAHGGPVRIMVCGLLELPLEAYPRIRVDNTSVARIHFTARGAIVAGLNDTAHLKAAIVDRDRPDSPET